MTERISVTRFFRTKIVPPTIWNARDFVLQIFVNTADLPGKWTPLLVVNHIWWQPSRPQKKSSLKSEKTFLHKQLKSTLNKQKQHQKIICSHWWRWFAIPRIFRATQTRKAHYCTHRMSTKNVSYCIKNYKYTNIQLYSMAPLKRVPSILPEQDADPVLLDFKKQSLDYLAMNKFKQQSLDTLGALKKAHHIESWYLVQTILQRCDWN